METGAILGKEGSITPNDRIIYFRSSRARYCVNTTAGIACHGAVHYLRIRRKTESAILVVEYGGIDHIASPLYPDAATGVPYGAALTRRIVVHGTLADKRRIVIYTFHFRRYINGTTLKGIVVQQETTFYTVNATIQIITFHADTATLAVLILTSGYGETIHHGGIGIVVVACLRGLHVERQHVRGIVATCGIGGEDKVYVIHRVIPLDVTRKDSRAFELVRLAERLTLLNGRFMPLKAAIKLHAGLQGESCRAGHDIVVTALCGLLVTLHPDFVTCFSLVKCVGQRDGRRPGRAVSPTLCL